MGAHIYFVHWPDHDVAKVGYAGNLRERVSRYTSKRGAVLVAQKFFEDFNDAFAAETRAAEAFGQFWSKAFSARDEAEPLVGLRGSGWTECYLMDGEDVPSALCLFEEAAR